MHWYAKAVGVSSSVLLNILDNGANSSPVDPHIDHSFAPVRCVPSFSYSECMFYAYFWFLCNLGNVSAESRLIADRSPDLEELGLSALRKLENEHPALSTPYFPSRISCLCLLILGLLYSVVMLQASCL